MTTYTPIVPSISGSDDGPYKAAAASDKITAGGRILLRIENGAGAPITCTVEDVNTPLPAGAASPNATFADLVITVPANDQVVALIGNTSRFADPSTGLVALTWSSTTTVTWNAYDVS